MTHSKPSWNRTRHRGTKRRVLGAALVGGGVVCLVLFVATRWKRLEVRCPAWGSHRVILGGGTIGYYRMNLPEAGGIDWDDSPSPQWHLWNWWWDTRPKGWSPPRLQCGGPLWPAAAVLLGSGAWLVLAGKRAGCVAGVCRACGYDVRGLKVCPECGLRAHS